MSYEQKLLRKKVRFQEGLASQIALSFPSPLYPSLASQISFLPSHPTLPLQRKQAALPSLSTWALHRKRPQSFLHENPSQLTCAPSIGNGDTGLLTTKYKKRGKVS
jgi:hypothetical protein